MVFIIITIVGPKRRESCYGDRGYSGQELRVAMPTTTDNIIMIAMIMMINNTNAKRRESCYWRPGVVML